MEKKEANKYLNVTKQIKKMTKNNLEAIGACEIIKMAIIQGAMK